MDSYETQILDDGQWSHDLEVITCRADKAAREAIIDATKEDGRMAGYAWSVRARLEGTEKWHTYNLTPRFQIAVY